MPTSIHRASGSANNTQVHGKQFSVTTRCCAGDGLEFRFCDQRFCRRKSALLCPAWEGICALQDCALAVCSCAQKSCCESMQDTSAACESSSTPAPAASHTGPPLAPTKLCWRAVHGRQQPIADDVLQIYQHHLHLIPCEPYVHDSHGAHRRDAGTFPGPR